MQSPGEEEVAQPTPASEAMNEPPPEAETAKAEDHDAMEIPEDADEETRLKFLTVGSRDQDDLERDIGRQADEMMLKKSDELDMKRIEKTQAEIKRAEAAIQKLQTRLMMHLTATQKAKAHAEIKEYNEKIDGLHEDIVKIEERIAKRNMDRYGEETQDGSRRMPGEKMEDFLVKTGKVTPFMIKSQRGADQSESALSAALLNAEVEDMVKEAEQGPKSHQNLMKPGFEDVTSASEAGTPHPEIPRPAKRRRTTAPRDSTPLRESSSAPETPDSDDAYTPDMDDRELAALDESEGVSDEEDEDYNSQIIGRKRKAAAQKKAAKPKASKATDEIDDLAGVDDGNEKVYKARLRTWNKGRAEARRRAREKRGEPVDVPGEEDEEECYRPHPTVNDLEISEGFRIPGDIHPPLYDYQKVGIQWLHELYDREVGGILADEMGLGKTVQAVSFIAGLHYSKLLTKPVIVVCPATVMKQWVNEFHRWWPPLRVSILHSTGSGMLNSRDEDRMEREMERMSYGAAERPYSKAGIAAKKIVERVEDHGHVLVTTYAGLQTYEEFLLDIDWETAILDEGHKIRNPNTAITMAAKGLRTANRIILSGTPMQNNLTELWSLIDFVSPMRLGTLVEFRHQFEFPIKRGGYANASNLEYETAVKCAETLKDAVSTYLLQRFKSDVAQDLPDKKEHVLFCKLTTHQRDAYNKFLQSADYKSILDGKRQMLYGVDYLRKICNHPDLTDHKNKAKNLKYGDAKLSGKMQVVKELISLWKKKGHKSLLFCQHKIMLDIMESYLNSLPGITYMRMDGETPIKIRQDMVDEFNRNPDIDVFLLTTKVGGLGVNLTGATRVIIYDPDWNPSTDIQARERSWRLGQKHAVEIYRLMCAGTIEEKIYHRQIFKQFLTNKVLKDPNQRNTFQMSDLHDLFTLGTDDANGETETGSMFRNSKVRMEDSAAPEQPSSGTDVTATAPEDLAAVSGIHHAEAYYEDSDSPEPKTSDTPNNTDSTNHSSSKSDDRLLSTIFAKTGVHSVLEHDAIVNSGPGGRKRKPEVSRSFLEREAKRAAQEAVEHLKRAEEQAKNAPVGVPTWTGTYGQAGRPRSPPPRATASARGGRGGAAAGRGGGGRGGPSSAGVLANLAARQGLSTPSSTGDRSRSGTPTSTSSTAGGTGAGGAPRGRRMLDMLLNYMLAQDGPVPTSMLINQFDHYCKQVPGRSDEFKEMLNMVATLERGAGRRGGRWVLKEEWKKRAAGRGGGSAGAVGAGVGRGAVGRGRG